MKLKMPITLYDVSVHPKLQNLNYYAKEINFFPPNLLSTKLYTQKSKIFIHALGLIWNEETLSCFFIYIDLANIRLTE